jgi:hypothetical protein
MGSDVVPSKLLTQLGGLKAVQEDVVSDGAVEVSNASLALLFSSLVSFSLHKQSPALWYDRLNVRLSGHVSCALQPLSS